MHADDPPRPLDTAGRALWDAVQTEYQIGDAAGVETLMQICLMADRAEQLAAAVAKDGLMTGTRGNPLLKEELQVRSFIVRSLSRLGLDLEPARPVGRPPGPQWKGHNRHV
jgi:hypothetical protein